MKTTFFQENDEFSSDEEIKVKKPKNSKPKKDDKTKEKPKPVKKVAEDKVEQKRLKSEKAKRFSNFTEIGAKLNQFIRILDYEKILEQFENLQTELKKSQKLIEEDGHPDDYLRSVIKLENLVSNVTNDQKKKMTKMNAKAFTKLKQNLTKNNNTLRDTITAWQEAGGNVDAGEEDEEAEASEEEASEDAASEEDSESDDDSGSGSDSDSSSGSESDSDSDDSDKKSDGSWDESDSEEEDVVDRKQLDRTERRKFWLKKADDIADEAIKKEGMTLKQKPRREAHIKNVDQNVINVDIQLDFERSEHEINKCLTEVAQRRATMDIAKLQTDILTLKYCLGDDLSEIKQLDIIIVLLNLRNELTESYCMERDMWQASYSNLTKFLQIVTNNPNIRDGKVTNYLKNAEQKYTKEELMDLIKSNIMNIDQQWNIAVRLLDQHDLEYELRLRDENELLKLMNSCINYFQNQGNAKIVGEISFRFLEHIYHNSQQMITKIRERVHDYIVPEDSQAFIRKLARYIYDSSPHEKYIAKTALYEAYNYAINDEYIKAKDLMLMSKIPETHGMSEGTILMVYNRSLVQLGICAFRKGMILEAKEI